MQDRRWNYKDDDATALFNRCFTGIIPWGLYHGFDFVPASDLNLQLNHQTTGFTDVDKDGEASAKMGCFITKQGIVIKQDDSLTIGSIAPGNGINPRIDIVIAEHQYVLVVGGQQALYSIIQGTPAASPVAPALTDPNKQIILGYLYMPAAATALDDTGVTYTRAGRKEFGLINFAANEIAVTDTDGNLTTSPSLTSNLSGLTGNVQGQINSLNTALGTKQDIITGAITTVLTSNLIPDRAVISNGTGKLISSTVAAADLLKLPSLNVIVSTSSDDNVRKVVKKIPIGVWNMQGADKVITHGLGASWNKVIAVDVMVFNDAQDRRYSLIGGRENSSATTAGLYELTPSTIGLKIIHGGNQFDASIFSSTSIDRGTVYITYEV